MRTLQPEPIDVKPIKMMLMWDHKRGDTTLVFVAFGAKKPLGSIVWTIGLN